MKFELKDFQNTSARLILSRLSAYCKNMPLFHLRAFDAGTIGPDGDAGEVAMQEREQGFALFRRDVGFAAFPPLAKPSRCR